MTVPNLCASMYESRRGTKSGLTRRVNRIDMGSEAIIIVGQETTSVGTMGCAKKKRVHHAHFDRQATRKLELVPISRYMMQTKSLVQDGRSSMVLDRVVK